ncbi:glycosyltransferase family 39 protein [Rhodopseudomonas sp. B29]|uniref:glycosyltransferase family 39 protein n=1 Tax=Rhodopseudomonas sp. B29 TaxID=95607 RepID=UPI001FCBD0C7|nr:glycosyltransferase family 39 protein [Rhodopseudomonas sp. B29]
MIERTLSRSGFSIGLLSVLVAAVLLPVALSALAFPTPLYDTRELIAWGRHFPWITPVHPPMMVWVGGLVDAVAGPSGIAMVLVGQLLLAVGLAYSYGVLRLVTERGIAAFATVLAGTSLYAVVGPLSWALNADILQLTSWPAVIYHLLRARSTDRWLHWILLGAWAAAAALTKYNAFVLFFGIACALLALPTFRVLLRRPGFYAAALICGLLLLPHVLMVYRFHTTLTYGSKHFHGLSSPLETAKRVGCLLLGYLPMLLPGALVVAIGCWRGALALRLQRFAVLRDEVKFLVLVNIAMFLLLLVFVVLLGLQYIVRYGAPFAQMAMLALAPMLDWRPGRQIAGERHTAVALGGFYAVAATAACVAYLGFFSHSGLQEPTAAAARAIMADWNSRYHCGPGYILGDRQTVYGVGIAAEPKIDSLAVEYIPRTPWFDPEIVLSKGAVLVYSLPSVPDQFAALFPEIKIGKERQITLPVLRTMSGKTKTYTYRFVPPGDCRN